MTAASQFQAERVSSTRTAARVTAADPTTAANDDLRASRKMASARIPTSTGKTTRTSAAVTEVDVACTGAPNAWAITQAPVDGKQTR